MVLDLGVTLTARSRLVQGCRCWLQPRVLRGNCQLLGAQLLIAYLIARGISGGSSQLTYRVGQEMPNVYVQGSSMCVIQAAVNYTKGPWQLLKLEKNSLAAM